MDTQLLYENNRKSWEKINTECHSKNFKRMHSQQVAKMKQLNQVIIQSF